jgi:hypothetical protein
MQNLDVIHAFLHQDHNCHTKNVFNVNCGNYNKLVNYDTTIAVAKNAELIISTKKYSTTTSKIQTQIRNGARRLGYKISEVYEIEK